MPYVGKLVTSILNYIYLGFDSNAHSIAWGKILGLIYETIQCLTRMTGVAILRSVGFEEKILLILSVEG